MLITYPRPPRQTLRKQTYHWWWVFVFSVILYDLTMLAVLVGTRCQPIRVFHHPSLYSSWAITPIRISRPRVIGTR